MFALSGLPASIVWFKWSRDGLAVVVVVLKEFGLHTPKSTQVEMVDGSEGCNTIVRECYMSTEQEKRP